MRAICEDLRAEYGALDAVVADLAAERWKTGTPFCGWSVLDQIAHLAFIDGEGLTAIRQPEAFSGRAAAFLAAVGRDDSMPRVVEAMTGGPQEPRQVLATWRATRGALLAELERMDPPQRLPWYGPAMGARSFATARLMETWAHGQDVCDALGRRRTPTDRLRHVAHLGVATFGWSFQNRGLAVPAGSVRVELTSPSGALWEWGDPDAVERVAGTVEEFCLVVTRRRHRRDTAVVCEGEVARRWMEIAQCFAGPAVAAPEPGKRA